MMGRETSTAAGRLAQGDWALLSEAPESLLRQSMALYRLFDPREREVIDDFVRHFYQRKTLYVHADVACSAALLAAVAGQAALVGAAQRTHYFAQVRWLYFCGDDLDVDGEVSQSSTVRLDAEVCLRESCSIVPGQNLVIHEFAHVLDQQFAISGSTAALRDAYRRYPQGLDDGLWQSAGGLDGLILGELALDDDGGMLDCCPPEEFFAYLSEAFFTQPQVLRTDDPELYADLVAVYGLDMAHLFCRQGLA